MPQAAAQAAAATSSILNEAVPSLDQSTTDYHQALEDSLVQVNLTGADQEEEEVGTTMEQQECRQDEHEAGQPQQQ